METLQRFKNKQYTRVQPFGENTYNRRTAQEVYLYEKTEAMTPPRAKQRSRLGRNTEAIHIIIIIYTIHTPI